MNGWSCCPKHGPAHITVLKQLFVWLIWNFLKTFSPIAKQCFSKHGPVPFTVLKNLFVCKICSHFENIQADGCAAPQHPLSRPSSICGVEESFQLDVMQTINSVQMNVCSCSPKHRPAQLTVLSQLFVRMAWSFSKTLEILAKSCSPKHDPNLFTVLKTFFVWVLCSHLKTFKLMAGPRSPTSPITAQLYLRR